MKATRSCFCGHSAHRGIEISTFADPPRNTPSQTFCASSLKQHDSGPTYKSEPELNKLHAKINKHIVATIFNV